MTRRRLYLMRHAEVSYFRSDGSPVNPTEVPLNEDGVAQAHVVAEAFRTIELDRVVTSGLPRTLETAGFVAPGVEPESWPELREIQGGRLSEIPADALEREFVHAFRGVIPSSLSGTSVGFTGDPSERKYETSAWRMRYRRRRLMGCVGSHDGRRRDLG